MASLLGELQRRLAVLDEKNLRRSLQPAQGIDLSSNDYLGLASHPGLVRGIEERLAAMRSDLSRPAASPASRLLRGNTQQHMDLEARLAAWKGTPASLLFASGYQANVGLLSTLVEPGDRVISDEANHASLIDGLRLARCSKIVVPHVDLDAVERALAASANLPEGRTFLLTESLYSMDGDIAPLDVYAELAQCYGAELIIDDSHATGVYGDDRGSGLCEEFGVTDRALAVVSTFGKALGLSGGFIAGSTTLIDYLVNRCRAFIFTTASPPLHLYAIEAALDLVQAEPQRRQQVLRLAADLRNRLRQGGVDCLGSRGPIVPVKIGDSKRALEVAAQLQAEGFDVRAIRPPTVAPGSARLRLSVHADHRPEDLERLAERLLAILPSAGLPTSTLPSSLSHGGEGTRSR